MIRFHVWGLAVVNPKVHLGYSFVAIPKEMSALSPYLEGAVAGGWIQRIPGPEFKTSIEVTPIFGPVIALVKVWGTVTEELFEKRILPQLGGMHLMEYMPPTSVANQIPFAERAGPKREKVGRTKKKAEVPKEKAVEAEYKVMGE